jgi:hypothetical protein
LKVRKLLKAFEARPPPLNPLQSSLRDTFFACPANSLSGGFQLPGTNFILPFHFSVIWIN